MYFLIGADFVPTSSNVELFKNANINELIGEELSEVIHSASFRIFNLEVPLTDISAPIVKCGPNLIAPTSTINGYKAIEVDLFTLANNHILDQGESGLYSTINVLDNNQISYIGAGKNLSEACRPYYFCFNNKKIGIYACCEHEFSVATDKTPGANPFDPLFSLDHIINIKKTCDYLIVLYHGGKECYRYPTPNLQRTCRRLVDKGADLVICQHSHCIGSKEVYQNSVIVYGQGNFLFDRNDNEYWNTSFLIKIDDNFNISYIPIVKRKHVVRAASQSQSNEIIRAFDSRSKQLYDSDFVYEQFKVLSSNYKYFYINSLYGRRRSLFDRILVRLFGRKYHEQRIINKYDESSLIPIRNYIECETHREVLLQALSTNDGE